MRERKKKDHRLNWLLRFAKIIYNCFSIFYLHIFVAVVRFKNMISMGDWHIFMYCSWRVIFIKKGWFLMSHVVLTIYYASFVASLSYIMKSSYKRQSKTFVPNYNQLGCLHWTNSLNSKAWLYNDTGAWGKMTIVRVHFSPCIHALIYSWSGSACAPVWQLTSVVASMEAPCLRRSSTTLIRFFLHAMWSGVNPFSARAFTSAWM